MTLSATVGRYYPTPCTQKPGPADHAYLENNTCEGVILHSAGGNWSDVYSPTDTMNQREVSWHFTVYRDGRVQQHYSIAVSCWHAGSGKQNRRLIGVEHEGTGPLTAAQLASSQALVRWLREQCQWPTLRRGVTMFEHRDVNSGTECPSGRIPWHAYESPIVSEVFPEADMDDVSAFWQAVISPSSRPDVDVDAIAPSRPGWHAFRVEIKGP